MSDLDRIARALPIYEHEEQIVETVRKHRVVVIEGPAGTGKTTQLPRMLRRAGVTTRCMGITQPRRIAAVSVAWRIAAEEAVQVGQQVGYAIRFDDMTSPSTVIKVMTDGILLQQARGDPDLSAYDIIMVDEAHERSLNIDFVLGLLHRLLQRRGDLRVLVSSATINPETFQRFFEPVAGRVPMVSVGARLHPVEMRYEPLPHRAGSMVAEVVARRVVRLHREGGPGHVLAFLPGEGAIKRTETAIHSLAPGRDLVVMPLYSRLPRAEQERVFDQVEGCRKVILATNIAETSITVPGVNFVIDPGLRKLPWYNTSTGVATLREGPISRSSADQRAGRAGRTGPGTVIRLYPKRAYDALERFDPEEILRVDLSEVVLRLIDLGVRDVERFPFPTRPPRTKLRAALETLRAMGAIDRGRELTAVGKRMVPFPLTPQLARMVVEAAERFPGAVDDVLLVGAFLSARTPFLFPAGLEHQARRAHLDLQQPLGDAITAIHAFRLWERARDKNGFCKQRFLDVDTMAFVDKAHRQLVDIARGHGVDVRGTGGDPTEVIRSVATGFADKVMFRRGHTYETPTRVRVSVHPSSALYGCSHRFVCAAELMKSGRVYAFQVSALRGEWLAEVNPDAARQWQIRRRPDRRQAPPTPPGVPETLVLGGVVLPVVLRNGRARVDVPLESVAALLDAGGLQVPEQARPWRARVVTEQGVYLRGTLETLVRLLPHAPLPQPGGDSALPSGPQAPLGALLEPDRNLHTLGLHLAQLLSPVAAPRRHRRAGWLALVSNGGGGYWYEVILDFQEALITTVDALADLAAGGPVTVPILEAVQERLQTLSRLHEAVQSELSVG